MTAGRAQAPKAVARYEGRRRLYHWFTAFGLDPLALVSALRGGPAWIRDLWAFRRQDGHRTKMRLQPAFRDRVVRSAGSTNEYFQVDLWAARKVFRAAPDRHVDVGSRIDGFVAHLLCFRDVEVVDVRPLPAPPSGMDFIVDDATSLASLASHSVPSLSSLHALEHFGLGRYGDPVDAEGHVLGLHALQRVLAPSGDLYLAVPIGHDAVYFNSHRTIDPELIVASLSELELVDFVAWWATGERASETAPARFASVDYALGAFHFRRPS